MNRFSIKRVFQLLRVDLIFEGKGLLIGLLTLIAILALTLKLMEPDFTYETSSRVLNTFLPIYLFTMGISFFARTHKLLHNGSAHPYVSIPATAGEKFLEILMLGVIYFCIIVIPIQINLWFESWLYPQTNYHSDYQLYHVDLLVSGTLFVNPASFFSKEVLSISIYIIGLLLLVSVAIPRKIFAYPLFFILPIVIAYLLSKIFMIFGWNRVDSIIQTGDTYLVFPAIIGITALVSSYFILRKKEVKS